MPARSLAALTLSFGLVNVPVRLYSATESKSAVSFHWLAADGARVRQQYVSTTTGKVVERSEMQKGYEFEKDRFVVFTVDELKALDESASHVIEIVAFVPVEAVDPLYYDRAYFLAPDKRGGKPYSLLRQAMRETGRCALARWVMKGKQYVAQVRASDDGLVLQQLLYADEVRSLKDLEIDDVAVSKAELTLAVQLIDSITRDSYDPSEFQDEEKSRVLEAIDRKIAGQEVVESVRAEEPVAGAQVIDLAAALRASLSGKPKAAAAGKPAAKAARPASTASAGAAQPPATALGERKPARRVTPAKTTQRPAKAAAPVKVAAGGRRAGK